MAALTKRDIEMIFRANVDGATRPVNDLAKDVAGLRKTLNDLITSSDKSEKSLDDLAKTTRDLQKAQDELGTARGLLTQLNAQQNALDRAGDAAVKAQAKYDQLASQIAGAEAPSKRLTTSLEAAGRAVSGTSAKLDAAKKDFAEVKTQVESIIGPVDNYANAFEKIAVTQRDIAQGLAISGAAVADFKKELVSANAAADDMAKFNNLAAKSPLSADQISGITAYYAQADQRIQALKQEEAILEASRKNDASAEAARKAKQIADIDSLLAGNKALENEIAQVAAESARLESISAYRDIAAQANAAVDSQQRVAVAFGTSSTNAQKFASVIMGITSPAREMATTLAGALSQIDAAEAKIQAGKLRPSEFNDVANSLAQAEATLVRIANAADNFQGQQASLDAATAAYDRQVIKVRELAAALATSDTPTKAMATALNQAETELGQLGTALDAEVVKLNTFGDALHRSGVDAKNLGPALNQIEAGARKAAPSIEKVAAAIGGGAKGGGFLGLKPYELQNLSYQVNDVFTSLASGAPPTQVFAQQFGQIAQLFPGLISSMAAFIIPLTAAGVAFAVVAGSIGEANNQIERLRNATALLATLGETSGYTAEQLTKAQDELRGMGVAADDAEAAVAAFVKGGLNPKSFDDFVVAARNFATVSKQDVGPAAEELTKAFTGGADAVLDLDNKYGFLTDTQRDNLVASKDTKNEYNEVNKAFTSLYEKMQAGADASKGPYTDAANTLRGAWRGLLQTFADTGAIEAVTTALANAAYGLSYLLNLAKRVAPVFANMGPGGILNPLNIAQVGKNLFNGAGSGAFGGALDDTNKQQAAAQAASRKQQAKGNDAGSGSAGRQLLEEKKAEKDRKKREADAKKAGKEAETEAKKRAREAAALAKQYANEQDQLTSAMSRFTITALKGADVPLQAQLDNAKQSVDEQFKSLEDRLEEFRAKFGDKALINGQTQADYAKQLAANKAAITQAKQLGVYEQNVNDILKERADAVDTILAKEDAGVIGPQEALDQVSEVTSTINAKLMEAIANARVFLATVGDSANKAAILAKLDLAEQEAGPAQQNKELANTATKLAGEQEAKLNLIISQRNNLIAAQNALYETGAQSYSVTQENIKNAYERTTGALKEQTAAMLTFLEANRALFDPVVYDTLIAKLQNVGVQAKYVSEQTRAVKQAAQDAIANGLTNMFDTFAQSLANVIKGTGSLKDVLGDLGRAALNFAATFAKAIADAIIQLYALKIAKSIAGFHGGGVVGNSGGSVMKLNRDIGGLSGAALSVLPRYHEGTAGVGLKPNEQLAVLEKGEKVTTEEQQRLETNRINALKKGKGGNGIRQVLAIGDSEVASAMSGAAGQDVVLTHLQRNKTTIKQMLGIS